MVMELGNAVGETLRSPFTQSIWLKCRLMIWKLTDGPIVDLIKESTEMLVDNSINNAWR